MSIEITNEEKEILEEKMLYSSNKNDSSYVVDFVSYLLEKTKKQTRIDTLKEVEEWAIFPRPSDGNEWDEGYNSAVRDLLHHLKALQDKK